MNKPPFVVKDIMKVVSSKSMFLTVTLPPKLYKFSSVTQLEITNKILYSILNATTDDYFVLAEHTKQGNIHYHAMVTCSEKRRYVLLMNKLKTNRSFGFIKLIDIGNYNKCAEYMYKDVYDNDIIFKSVRGHQPEWFMNNEIYNQIKTLIMNSI